MNKDIQDNLLMVYGPESSLTLLGKIIITPFMILLVIYFVLIHKLIFK